MKRNHTLLILSALLIFYTACQKDGKVSPNATQTIKPASPTDSTKNNTTDSTKKSTIHATKITDTFRQLPIIYPYTQTAVGMMHDFLDNDYERPNFYDSSSTFIFYIRHISKDSVEFSGSKPPLYNYYGVITATFGVNSANIYSISFKYNTNDIYMPASSYNFKLVNDSLYASWDYYIPQGCSDWLTGIGTFAGKIQ